jgi:hypothetical protein
LVMNNLFWPLVLVEGKQACKRFVDLAGVPTEQLRFETVREKIQKNVLGRFCEDVSLGTHYIEDGVHFLVGDIAGWCIRLVGKIDVLLLFFWVLYTLSRLTIASFSLKTTRFAHTSLTAWFCLPFTVRAVSSSPTNIVESPIMNMSLLMRYIWMHAQIQVPESMDIRIRIGVQTHVSDTITYLRSRGTPIRRERGKCLSWWGLISLTPYRIALILSAALVEKTVLAWFSALTVLSMYFFHKRIAIVNNRSIVIGKRFRIGRHRTGSNTLRQSAFVSISRPNANGR